MVDDTDLALFEQSAQGDFETLSPSLLGSVYQQPVGSNGDEGGSSKKGGNSHAGVSNQGGKNKVRSGARKGIPFSEDDHRLAVEVDARQNLNVLLSTSVFRFR
ncbi:PREDICTED: uncharacterized protein LOC104706353 [Camelina sativa]|uniref:Uncharacterized protein LOC104706353 n=1 Tax=Camelina sativa TaxID=90675 RepID=A0ABM0T4P8_CAMSA|nr:PREDICTED: uncharacterized protein LOC104706353 [Camelina sativa]